MALQPSTFTGQDRLQPGARGQKFEANVPGYRNSGDNRINRTNNKLNTNAHDVPNIKYEFDRRLPVLFKYGFAFGYNQIVIPKGRLVAVDPNMDLVDFDMHHAHSTLTLANGGAPVKLRAVTDKYTDISTGAQGLVNDASLVAANTGVEWMPLRGFAKAYAGKSYRAFHDKDGDSNDICIGPEKQLTNAAYLVDENTGKIKKGTIITNDVRPGNVPTGVLQRNEYTRDDDAYNGIMPGAVLTDAMIEMPWFSHKDKAEGNPWGSAYGILKPGMLVKSDENGRFVPSPLSFESDLETMTMMEAELERQQVVGQVYAIDNSLIPEGSAKWAQWALSERMNFNEINPSVYAQNNRNGEDAINNSPYKSNGEYPGYPYDRNANEHDLHMISQRGSYDPRMQEQYIYDNGIPGLTDGKNVINAIKAPFKANTLRLFTSDEKTAGQKHDLDIYIRTLDVDVNSLCIATSEPVGTWDESTQKFTGTTKAEVGATFNGLTIKYVDELQGLLTLEVTDENALGEAPANATEIQREFPIWVIYKKRGQSGVPTFLDWDGVVGSVKILLTK